MTIREAADMLGVCPDTVSRAIRRGDIPVPLLQIGRCLRIPRARFTEYVSGGPSAPPDADGADPTPASSASPP